MSEAQTVDVVIIGGGLAGTAAANTCMRGGARVVVLEPLSIGGEAINVPEIDQLIESEIVSGPELAASLTERLLSHNVDLRLGETATSLARDGNAWRVETQGEALHGLVAIVCTGASHRPLSNRPEPEDDPLFGAGIFTCAPCDAPLYAGKRVGIAGGGDTGAEAAIILSPYASEVLLFESGPRLTCQTVLRDRLAALPNVVVRCGAEVQDVAGANTLEGVRVLVDGAEQEVGLGGLMLAVGLRPRSELLAPHAKLDEDGAAQVAANLSTSAPGLFAAGDLRAGSPYRFSSAWADGLTAAGAALASLHAPRATR